MSKRVMHLDLTVFFYSQGLVYCAYFVALRSCYAMETKGKSKDFVKGMGKSGPTERVSSMPDTSKGAGEHVKGYEKGKTSQVVSAAEPAKGKPATYVMEKGAGKFNMQKGKCKPGDSYVDFVKGKGKELGKGKDSVKGKGMELGKGKDFVKGKKGDFVKGKKEDEVGKGQDLVKGKKGAEIGKGQDFVKGKKGAEIGKGQDFVKGKSGEIGKGKDFVKGKTGEITKGEVVTCKGFKGVAVKGNGQSRPTDPTIEGEATPAATPVPAATPAPASTPTAVVPKIEGATVPAATPAPASTPVATAAVPKIEGTTPGVEQALPESTSTPVPAAPVVKEKGATAISAKRSEAHGDKDDKDCGISNKDIYAHEYIHIYSQIMLHMLKLIRVIISKRQPFIIRESEVFLAKNFFLIQWIF